MRYDMKDKHRHVRFDRVLVKGSAWQANEIELLGREPMAQSLPRIFPSDHFGVVCHLAAQRPGGPVRTTLGAGPPTQEERRILSADADRHPGCQPLLDWVDVPRTRGRWRDSYGDQPSSPFRGGPCPNSLIVTGSLGADDHQALCRRRECPAVVCLSTLSIFTRCRRVPICVHHSLDVTRRCPAPRLIRPLERRLKGRWPSPSCLSTRRAFRRTGLGLNLVPSNCACLNVSFSDEEMEQLRARLGRGAVAACVRAPRRP